jgi:hypothetical protein
MTLFSASFSNRQVFNRTTDRSKRRSIKGAGIASQAFGTDHYHLID